MFLLCVFVCKTVFYFFFFFFSSRRRHTRLQGDWSSDVCSSDLKVFSSFALLIYSHPQCSTPRHPQCSFRPSRNRRAASKIAKTSLIISFVASSRSMERIFSQNVGCMPFVRKRS